MSVDAVPGGAAGDRGSTQADTLPRLAEGRRAAGGPEGSDRSAGGDGEGDGLREAARKLEGLFIQKLFQAMRSTVPDGGYLDAGRGEKMFRGFMDRHLAEQAAERMDRGLADALYRQLRGAVEGDDDVNRTDDQKIRSGGQP